MEAFLAFAGEVTNASTFAGLLRRFSDLTGHSAERVARDIRRADPSTEGFSERTVKGWWAEEAMPQQLEKATALTDHLAAVVADLHGADGASVKRALNEAGLRAFRSRGNRHKPWAPTGAPGDETVTTPGIEQQDGHRVPGLPDRAAVEVVRNATPQRWPALCGEVVALWETHLPDRAGEIRAEVDSGHTGFAAIGAGPTLSQAQLLVRAWTARFLDLLTASPAAAADVRRLIQRAGEQRPSTQTIIASAPGAFASGAMNGNVIHHHYDVGGRPPPPPRATEADDGCTP